MIITKTKDSSIITLALCGRIDTVTSNQLSNEFDSVMSESFDKLVLDFSGIDYISSAGLRVIINMQKKITARRADMELIRLNDPIKNIFEITGFSKILTIH
jgi:anti-sigma B factor antagonist